jgi:DNA polymerase-1
MINKMAEKFVIIDGSSLMYRAFYALPLLTDSRGRYTNAAYGFAKMFMKIIEDYRPDTVAIAFDKGKKTFRNDLYGEYKGTRKATPAELLEQIPLIHELAEAMGVRLVEQAGFEADDIIGTLSTKAAKKGVQAIVVTGDRDALQLVQENLTVMLTKKGISELESYDENYFKEKYSGLMPRQLIDLKGLMGDSSDNIPGIAGIGEKTALKLLTQFGSVENVLENSSAISGKKLQEKIIAGKESALLSKKLATIVTDMDIDYDSAEFTMKTDIKRIKDFLTEYGFKSVLKQVDLVWKNEAADEFSLGKVEDDAKSLPEAEEIKSRVQAAELILRLKNEGRLTFVGIYTGAREKISLEGLYVIDGEKNIYFIAGESEAFNEVAALFADEQIVKVTHGLKELYRTGFLVKGEVFDTQVAAYLLEPSANNYDLSKLVAMYIGDMDYLVKEESPVWQSLVISELYAPLKEGLESANLTLLYKLFELPLIEVLAAMERTGIKVDRAALHNLSSEYEKKLADLAAEIHALAGTEFNVNSPKQLGQVLFERLELPVIKKTKSGYSTDAEVLEKLESEHPIVGRILEYRTLAKLKSTYLDGLDLLINDADSRVYARFNQTVTATGRLSSSEPNLQNIPVRTEEGRRIREFFVPGDGYDMLLSADYSQIELRILAHMSQDKNFLEAFQNGQDIHARTAAEVFGVPLGEVTAELRSRAKAVNFGIVYGISDFGLAKDLGVSRKVAGDYIASYFEKCSGVKEYIDKTVEDAHKDGFVTTMFGRRRYLPDINSRNFARRSFAERMAMNTPIQGTAADVIKKAMIDVYRALTERNLKSRILVQVHDELLLEVVNEEVDEVKEILINAMQSTVELSVPLTIDIHSGRCWAEAK